jgi:ribose transport system ATP-binding protein
LDKSYPGVHALREMTLEVKRGEAHALVGENGAGKSTFIKLISGAELPDNGTIYFEQQAFTKITPHKARGLGIFTIYQEFNLVPTLSVAENIYLGDYPIKRLVNYRELEQNTKKLLDEMNIHINPKKLVGELTVAYQQMVEIIKAISKDVKLLILDEPTAPLTQQEVNTLFHLIKKLKSNGVTFLYISHRLAELNQICDRVSVMRDGSYITTLDIKDAYRSILIRHMVGRQMEEIFPECTNVQGNTVFETKDLSGNGVTDISLQVKKGEILGLAGLIGAGRTEFAQLVFGLHKIEKGQVFMNGKQITIRKPIDAIAHGIGLIPEDRKGEGLVLCLSVKANIGYVILKQICKLMIVQKKSENNLAENLKKDLAIKTPTLDQLVENLSGGNQQKVVLAKWLAAKSKMLILDEPTRGIDVGAKQEFYRLIKELSDKGTAIIMISSEMEELFGMAHRIVVFCSGKIAGELTRPEYTQERVLELAASGM